MELVVIGAAIAIVAWLVAEQADANNTPVADPEPGESTACQQCRQNMCWWANLSGWRKAFDAGAQTLHVTHLVLCLANGCSTSCR